MTTDNSNERPMTANAMDFTPRPSAAFAANFAGIIDRAMQADNAAQPPRGYIGASRLGEECLRMLAYEFHQVPKDPEREFGGDTLRIFERGHTGEALMAARLRLAGFQLVTQRPDGNQIRFGTAWSAERQAFLMSGGVDGVVTFAPPGAGISCPALWEHKVRANKYWREVDRKGVRAAFPVYFAQMQLYMAYLDLSEHPALFTCENADTGQLYAELVPFDRAAAQAASDKGVRIVGSGSPDEMPRIATKSTDYRCKLCDFPGRCWGAPERPVVDYGVETFGGFGTRG